MSDEEINLEIFRNALSIVNKNIDFKTDAYRYNLEAGKAVGTFIPPVIDIQEVLKLSNQIQSFIRGNNGKD